MLKRKIPYILLTAAAIFFAACGKEDVVDHPRPDATDGDVVLAENPQIKAAVEAMARKAGTSVPSLNAVEVWQEGYLPSGAWLNGTARETRFQMWSVTKTFTGVAIGIAAGEGKLSLDEKVASIFPDEVSAAGKHMSDAEKARVEAITIEHLLTMSAGHTTDPASEYAKKYAISLFLKRKTYFPGDTPNVNAILEDLGTSIPELYFGHPFNAEPGKYFCYDTFASCMLSEIIRKKTGEDPADYLQKRLFDPLGISKPVWDKAGDGISAGGWGLHLSTDDMIRFGRMLLADGETSKGERILSPDYLKKARTSRIEQARFFGKDYKTTGYGYQMWTRDRGTMYMAVGLSGQYLVMIPWKKTVIAMTSEMPFDISKLTIADFSQVGSLFDGTIQSQAEAPLELAWQYIFPVL